MTGQAWCIAGAIVEAVICLHYTHGGNVAKSRQAEILATIWLAAAIIIGSLK